MTIHAHRQRNFTSPTYSVWVNMRKRCNNPNHKSYNYYGGRGIRVCKRWDDFSFFLLDMGKRPRRNGVLLTLDREDVNGNYEPDNCRWATQSQQIRNRRPY